jgi:CMP-2-keto-3-deoxyoctulosonic acid synthetase
LTVLGVVPARYASTRLEGKVLCDIGGKPMIQHVWERAMKAELLDEVIVAVDDARVYQAANDFGARAVMTSDEHVCGTERVEEAARNSTADIVVNIQGDEPFIPPGMIDETVQPLLDDPGLQMATVMRRITSEEELADPGVVKTVTDRDGFALYFSRSLIFRTPRHILLPKGVPHGFRAHGTWSPGANRGPGDAQGPRARGEDPGGADETSVRGLERGHPGGPPSGKGDLLQDGARWPR